MSNGKKSLVPPPLGRISCKLLTPRLRNLLYSQRTVSYTHLDVYKRQILVSITLVTVIRSIVILVTLNVVIMIINIVVVGVIWWIGTVSLVAITVVVITVVGVLLVPGFRAIVPPPALSVIFFVFVIFEQFCYSLYCLNLAASPCSDYLFIVMIR